MGVQLGSDSGRSKEQSSKRDLRRTQGHRAGAGQTGHTSQPSVPPEASGRGGGDTSWAVLHLSQLPRPPYCCHSHTGHPKEPRCPLHTVQERGCWAAFCLSPCYDRTQQQRPCAEHDVPGSCVPPCPHASLLRMSPACASAEQPPAQVPTGASCSGSVYAKCRSMWSVWAPAQSCVCVACSHLLCLCVYTLVLES